MMKYICIVLCCCHIGAIAQEVEYIDSLSLVEIINNDLYQVLDSIVDHEKKCDYYDPDLLFEIFIYRYEPKGVVTVQISAIGKRKYKIGNEKGVFRYQNHLFFVSEMLDPSVFCLTDDKLYYPYQVFRGSYKLDTGEIVIVAWEDDSFSYWNYYYDKGKFIFDSKSTYCQ